MGRGARRCLHHRRRNRRQPRRQPGGAGPGAVPRSVCTMRPISCARLPRAAPRLSPSPCSRAVSSNCGLSPSPTSAAGCSHVARSGCRTFRSPAPAQADERPRRAAAHPAPSRSQFRRLRARFRSLCASSRPVAGSAPRQDRSPELRTVSVRRVRVLPLVPGASAERQSGKLRRDRGVMLLARPDVSVDPASELRSKRDASRCRARYCVCGPGRLEAVEDQPYRHRAFADGSRGALD